MRTGKIYKIISGQGDECYVGSTFQPISHRWRDHKKGYRSYKKDKNNNISAFDLFDKYGVDNCAIILIKEYKVYDRTHMEAYEQLWINKLNCINKQNSFSIRKLYIKQYYEQNKDKLKLYREQNKDKIKEYHKQYQEQNKDKLKELKKQYQEQNKEELRQKRKERYAAKKAASIQS